MSAAARIAIVLALSSGAVLLAIPVPFAPATQAAAASCTARPSV